MKNSIYFVIGPKCILALLINNTKKICFFFIPLYCPSYLQNIRALSGSLLISESIQCLYTKVIIEKHPFQGVLNKINRSLY